MSEPSDTWTNRERGGFFSGKLIIFLTLSLVIIVPVVTYVVFQIASRDVQAAKRTLRWSNRAQWSGSETTPVSFRRGLMSSARTGKTFQDFDFSLDAATIEALQRCAALARRDRSAFVKPEVRRTLAATIAKHPALFYPQYLLGTWHRLNGEPTEAQWHYRLAFERAGAALIQPYETPAGEYVANEKVGTLAIAIDRVVKDRLIQDVQLVLPHLMTDANGRVYLPLFAGTPYRFADPTPIATQPRRRGWFTFPGQVGRAEPKRVTGDAATGRASLNPARTMSKGRLTGDRKIAARYKRRQKATLRQANEYQKHRFE